MITKLAVQNIRLIEKQTLDNLGQKTLFLGDNAQGKTTLLEAIYLLATFSSFRTTKEINSLSISAKVQPLTVGRVRAEYEKDGHKHTMEVRLILDSSTEKGLRKEILVDGVKRKAIEAIGSLRAVVFDPKMTDAIDGAQAERRRHMNMAISQALNGYAAALARYNQALAQRNALLRVCKKESIATQIEPWNSVLATSGAELIVGRIRACNQLSRLTLPFQKMITSDKEMLRVVYCPSFDPAAPQKGDIQDIQKAAERRAKISSKDIAAGLKKALEDNLSRDVDTRTTTVGPHRDNFEFWVNGSDLGETGSRGQVRTATLALKAAEAKWIENETGEMPVLLLDDPMNELDASRRLGLSELLKMPNQIFVTATETLQFPEAFLGDCSAWTVKNGTFQPAAAGAPVPELATP
jgi:recF protein